MNIKKILYHHCFLFFQLRAQNTVLKKAVIEEQEKTKSLQVNGVIISIDSNYLINISV